MVRTAVLFIGLVASALGGMFLIAAMFLFLMGTIHVEAIAICALIGTVFLFGAMGAGYYLNALTGK